MSDENYTNTSVSQGGKSGGDALGVAGASGFGMSGDASGFASGGGCGGGSVGLGGISGIGAGISGATGAVGGDVSDNTSIGSININS